MFRFTIRDVLWLTVVVGVTVLWWGEYRQRMLDSSDLRADYRRLEQERDKLMSSRTIEPNAMGMISVMAKQQEEINLLKRLVETYRAEREELKALGQDRAL